MVPALSHPPHCDVTTLRHMFPPTSFDSVLPTLPHQFSPVLPNITNSPVCSSPSSPTTVLTNTTNLSVSSSQCYQFSPTKVLPSTTNSSVFFYFSTTTVLPETTSLYQPQLHPVLPIQSNHSFTQYHQLSLTTPVLPTHINHNSTQHYQLLPNTGLPSTTNLYPNQFYSLSSTSNNSP